MARLRRSLLHALAAASVVTPLPAVLLPAPASADSIGTQIAAAQRQLDQLDQQAEVATERYNAARIKLAAAQRATTAAAHRLGAARTRLTSLRHSVSAFAVAAYTGDPLDTTLTINAANPQEFLDKLATLQAVSNSQEQALAAVSAAQHEEVAAQVQANAAYKTQQASTTQMQQDRNTVLAAADKEQRILDGLRARAARIAAARAAAAALARRAAAARAAAAALASQGVSGPVVTGSGGARVAVQWAYRELGKPYVWGAAGPDTFDCSGLTQYVWAKAGVYLDHYTGLQWNEGRHIPASELQPGDLVFFGSNLHHVGLYIGNGNMIEAPHTGAYVRISPYARPDFAGAVRPGG